MSIQSPSKTKETAEKTIYAAFKILHENGGKMQRKDVIEKIQETVKFTEWEMLPSESGRIRWINTLGYYLINCVKAGFVIRNNGEWILTDAGRKAIELESGGIFNAANTAYKKWGKDRKFIK
jgi:restriction system protein